MASIQDTLEMAVVDSPLGEDDLLFRRMLVTEHLSQPFEFALEVLSKEDDLKLDDVLGHPISTRLDLPEERDDPRYFHGHVVRMSHEGKYEGRKGRYTLYSLTLRPWIWLLTRTWDCRVFQEKSAKDIIKQIFDDAGFTDYDDKLSAAYRTRTYCVQYRESDFAFVSRLMEEEGIYYYFTHEKNKHTLVLCDAYSAHDKYKSYDELKFMPPEGQARHGEEHVSEWYLSQEVRSGAYTLTDFDFEKPRTDLKVKNTKARSHEQSKFEVYDFPGRYIETKDGEHYVRTRLESLQAGFEVCRAQANARGLCTGYLFNLEEYPREDQNREYLIVSAQLEMTSGEYEALLSADGRPRAGQENEREFDCHFTAIESKTPYRSPVVTPKAVVRGPQTAVVVGPKDEEIWTDKYGRVKVQFHWDREGKKDENSSCWVRTAQIWAGKKWGGIYIPRIGQEVIVEFLEGDPDRPIITGRVYNADQMPPYDLPANKTKSGVQSRSTLKGEAKHFNELRFDDKKDKEEIYFHAERDFNRVVENNDTLKVGYDVKDAGDQTIEIYNNQTITIEKGNQETTLDKGNRTVTVSKGDQTHNIDTGKRVATIKGDDNVTVSSGNQTIKISAGKHLTQAGQEILLKVGGNSIKIDNAGITIKGTKVVVQGVASADVKSPMTTVKGDGVLTLKGGLTKIN